MRKGTGKIVGPLLLLALFVLTTVLPLIGFAEPLLRNFPFERAMQEVGRTAGSTLFYSVAASVIATSVGVILALIAGRSPTNRMVLIGGLLLLLALPPSLSALGFIHLAGLSPSQLDPLLRSQFTVSVSLALRFVPSPPSLPYAASVQLRRPGPGPRHYMACL